MINNDMFMEYPDVLTIEELKESLRIGRSMAYRLIKNGLIKHMRIGNTIKIPKQFLIDYICRECYDNKIETGYLPQQKEAV